MRPLCTLFGHKMGVFRAQKGAANGGKPLFWYSFCKRHGCGHAETCMTNPYDNCPNFDTLSGPSEGGTCAL